MLKVKSLKKSIISTVIIFTLFFTSVVLSITIFSFFNLKHQSMQHSQKEILIHIKDQINTFINRIESLSSYLQKNNSNLDITFQNILNTNAEISTIIVFDKQSKVKKIYSKTEIYLKFLDDISKEKISIKNDWSDLIYLNFKKTPSIAYSFDLNKNRVVFLISLKKIKELTKTFKNSDNTSMVRLFDKNKKFIINTDIYETKVNQFDDKSNECFEKLIDKQEEFVLAKFKNICLGSVDYGMYTTIEKTSWKLLIRDSINVVENYILKVVFSLSIIIFIFTLLMLLFINKYLKRVFTRLSRFKSQFKDISNGEYQNELKYTDFYELNSFIRSFEKMRLELNKRELVLTENLDSFKKLVDSTMEGIIIHDKNLCLKVNNSAANILGYDNKSDLEGDSIFKIIPNKYKKVLANCFKNDIDVDEPKEFKLLKKDNTIIYVLAKDQEINFKDEKLRISLFLDITDIKEQNRIIMEQSKLSSIAQMLTNIAHHWRQPLSTISVLSSGMKLEKELDVLRDEELLIGLDKINKTTKELSSIIDRCSSYFELNKRQEVFDLIQSLDASLVFIEPILFKHEIKIIQKHQSKELFVQGYLTEFSQIVFNLLDNSKDAILNSKVKEKYILIETKKVNNKVHLKINDSGLGIKKTEIEKIFEPYYTTKIKEVGAGIGLYMAHYIITKHMKGNIKIKNNEFFVDNKKLYGLEVIIEFKIT